MAGSGNKGTVIPGNPPPPTSKNSILTPPGSGGRGGANPASSSPSASDVQTLPEPGEFASLELLHLIIQYLGHDLSNTKRLTFSSLLVVSHGAKLYKEIHELIKKVDNTESPDWVSYNKYLKAIEPLERYVDQLFLPALLI